MNYLSLFSGIGGLDLGLDRAGMTCVGQVEKDDFCRRVLAKHWPEVPRHDDVCTTVDWWGSGPRPIVHAVIGGYPCQPSSQAGPGLGASDERWLWPEMAAVIAALRPTWVIWENVPGLLTRGLPLVHRDLVELGYRHRVGWASACVMGAPHPRRRLFGVAHAAGQRCGTGRSVNGQRDVAQEARLGPESSGAAWWAVEPGVGRMAYGVPGRVDRCRALGNAVVPQVAEHIGRLILGAEAVAA